MKFLRTRLTYGNVTATLALFLALAGGTALAATRILPKNSVGSKQIKKGAVTPVKLSVAAKKALTGQAGAAGATGPQGKEGPRGPQGEPGPLLEVLPAGKTERGGFTFAGTRATGGAWEPAESVSYPIPLAREPKVEVVEPGEASTAHCTGSAANPTAASGYLCIYMTRNDGGNYFDIEVEEESQQKYGFAIYSQAGEGSNYEYGGTWAVTG